MAPKPRVYALDPFDPIGTAHARDKFDLISPGEPGWENWRDEAVGVMTRQTKITAADMAACKKLKFAARHGTGVDEIDLDAAKKYDVAVFNVPGVATDTVAEITVGFIISITRGIARVDRHIRNGEKFPAQKLVPDSVSVSGRTCGIIGGGNIGREVARKLITAFNTNVIMYDPFLPEHASSWSTLKHTRVNFIEELLKESDIVTLHLPLTSQTKDLITMKELKLMKPTSFLINAARGGIVNEKDLFDALRNKTISGAAIDAWTSEPPTRKIFGDNFDLDNLIITPHIGSATRDQQAKTCKMMVDRLYWAMTGEKIVDRVV